jgi:hypothetical protein
MQVDILQEPLSVRYAARTLATVEVSPELP